MISKYLPLAFVPIFSIFAGTVPGEVQEVLEEVQIKTIIITADLSEASPDLKMGLYPEGVKVVSPDYLSPLEIRLQQYIRKPLNISTLQEIKKEILSCAQTQNHTLLAVEIPNQEVSNRTVRFVILEAKVEDIVYCGNHYFSKARLQKKIHLQPGDIIDEDQLSNDLAWANRNPFHHSDVILTPGEKKGYTHVEVCTKDRVPWRFYAGADNTGTMVTNPNRLFVGFNWGDAFWLDDLLSYQFRTSPDLHRYKSHSLHYTSFLPQKTLLSVYGGYAEIHPKINGAFQSTGTCWQGSLRYTIPIKPLYTANSQEVICGFDYKNLNSNLFFVGENFNFPVATHSVNLTQFYAGYHMHKYFDDHHMLFDLDFYVSPFAALPNQNRSSYSQLRPHASPIYGYLQFALGDLYGRSRNWGLNWLLRGQAASGPLLSSEQFVLAGSNAVRGYEELAFISDMGILANLEARSPSFSFMKHQRDDLYFIAFVDAGWGYNMRTEDGFPSNETLVGIGPGIRYNASPIVTLKGDYGFQLHEIVGDDHLGRFHFSAVISY